MSLKNIVIVIVGPTASGKSAVALELAKKIDGEIVNADSRQIYKFLDIGTSKPSRKERLTVPHHLYDFLDPDQSYNAGEYAKDASETIRQIRNRFKSSIVVGGTGLYIRSLFDGLSPLPPQNPAFRTEQLRIALEKGKQNLHLQLKKVDPVSAEKIPYQNIQRVIRALEVHYLTGRPLSEWHKLPTVKKTNFQLVFFGILWERGLLKERILRRTNKILPGIVEETESLIQRGYTSEDPGLQSLGYKAALEFVQKKISRADFLNRLLLDTLHYAKRQMTWFKKDNRIRWIKADEPFNPEQISQQIIRIMI